MSAFENEKAKIKKLPKALLSTPTTTKLDNPTLSDNDRYPLNYWQ